LKLSVGLIDYGTGNIASLEMALADLDAATSLVSNAALLSVFDALILPGVGHFGPAASALVASGVREALLSLIDQGLPVLGICLGFQLLTDFSEEAPGVDGLGLLPGFTQRLRPRNTHQHKVPHLGWNSIQASADRPRLLHGLVDEDQLFYFANAYGVAAGSVHPLCHAIYHHESPWLALLEQGPVFGVQFHPEKSRSQGLQVLRNFLNVAREQS
jgi:glutamine amidotransferase